MYVHWCVLFIAWYWVYHSFPLSPDLLRHWTKGIHGGYLFFMCWKTAFLSSFCSPIVSPSALIFFRRVKYVHRYRSKRWTKPRSQTSGSTYMGQCSKTTAPRLARVLNLKVDLDHIYAADSWHCLGALGLGIYSVTDFGAALHCSSNQDISIRALGETSWRGQRLQFQDWVS